MPPLTVARPPAIAGLAWIKEGWRLFKLAPIPWTGMTALVFLVLMALGMLPLVGGLLVHILSPFVVAGYMAASRSGEPGRADHLHLSRGGLARRARRSAGDRCGLHAGHPADLQSGWVLHRRRPGSPAAPGPEPATLTPEEAESMVSTALPALSLGTLLFAPCSWLPGSPGLACSSGSPGRAMWWSLWACAVNWRPILYYSLMLGLAGMVAVLIPFGLGLLVFVPWTLTSTYAAYRDLFVPVESSTP
jgi:hypothetical protein